MKGSLALMRERCWKFNSELAKSNYCSAFLLASISGGKNHMHNALYALPCRTVSVRMHLKSFE